MSEVSVKELEKQVALIREKKDELAEIKAKQSTINQELYRLEQEAMALLESCEKVNYKGEDGTIYMQTIKSVKVPKDLESKKKLFDYIRSLGLYDELVSVNSQTLNALYRKEAEASEERGELMFKIPGLEDPTVSIKMGFRRR